MYMLIEIIEGYKLCLTIKEYELLPKFKQDKYKKL